MKPKYFSKGGNWTTPIHIKFYITHFEIECTIARIIFYEEVQLISEITIKLVVKSLRHALTHHGNADWDNLDSCHGDEGYEKSFKKAQNISRKLFPDFYKDTK